MFKKLFVSAFIVALVAMAIPPKLYAGSKDEKQAILAEKVKKGILQLGTGERVRVSVELRDKTKLDGYINSSDENSFVVTDPKSGNSTSVPYNTVKSVKGVHLSKKTKIWIGIGIAGLIAFLIWYKVVITDDQT